MSDITTVTTSAAGNDGRHHSGAPPAATPAGADAAKSHPQSRPTPKLSLKTAQALGSALGGSSAQVHIFLAFPSPVCWHACSPPRAPHTPFGAMSLLLGQGAECASLWCSCGGDTHAACPLQVATKACLALSSGLQLCGRCACSCCGGLNKDVSAGSRRLRPHMGRAGQWETAGGDCLHRSRRLV